MRNKTVDTFTEAKENPTAYIWEPAVAFHTVGPYNIIEYHPRKVDGLTVTRVPDRTRVNFHVFVGDQNTNTSYCTLDAALAGAIAYRMEGPNHRADRYFIAALESILNTVTADFSGDRNPWPQILGVKLSRPTSFGS